VSSCDGSVTRNPVGVISRRTREKKKKSGARHLMYEMHPADAQKAFLGKSELTTPHPDIAWECRGANLLFKSFSSFGFLLWFFRGPPPQVLLPIEAYGLQTAFFVDVYTLPRGNPATGPGLVKKNTAILRTPPAYAQACPLSAKPPYELRPSRSPLLRKDTSNTAPPAQKRTVYCGNQVAHAGKV